MRYELLIEAENAPMRYEFLIEAENDELLILNESTNYMEPISDIDSKKYLETMKYEIDSIYTNQV
jgi:hypothetical protein